MTSLDSALNKNPRTKMLELKAKKSCKFLISRMCRLYEGIRAYNASAYICTKMGVIELRLFAKRFTYET